MTAALVVAWTWWHRGDIPAPGPVPLTKQEFVAERPQVNTSPLRVTAPPARAAVALRLFGRVVGEKRQAVPDATVRMVGPASLTAQTDSRGEFLFEPTSEGAYFLDAEAGGAAAAPVLVHFTAQMGPVVLQLSKAARLRLSVVSATDGSPIRGAKVEVRAAPMLGETLLKTGSTNGDGELVVHGLAPGGYGIGAKAHGFRPQAKPLAPQAGLSWEATLALAPGSPVRGVVVDEAGRGVAGAVLRPYPSNASFESRPRAQITTVDAVSNESGSFVYPALESGTFRLLASHSNFLPSWSETFTMEGTPKTGLTVNLERGASIGGRVLKADGSSAARAVVRINAVAQNIRGAGVREVIAEEAGAFRLSGLPRAQLHLVASDPFFSSENIVVDTDRGDVRDLEIRLQLGGRIAGVVTDRHGVGIENAQVVCVGLPRGAIGTRPVLPETTDAQGRFTCSALAPGEYLLTAIRPYPNNNQSPAQRSAGASAQTGARDVHIVLPDDGAIVGRMHRAGQIVDKFTVGMSAGAAPRPFDSPDGSFTLDGLAPGSHLLHIAGPSFSRQIEILVPEGGLLDLGTIDVASVGTDSRRTSTP
jgi:hypothetical protein